MFESSGAASALGSRRNILQCCLCKGVLCEPKTLPCFHSFCSKCIEAYLRYKRPGDQVPCPVCHSRFNLPENGIKEMQLNTFMEKLLKAEQSNEINESQSKEVCACCSNKSSADANQAVAKWYCKLCKNPLCDTCQPSHLEHEIVELSSLPKSENSSAKSDYCREHSGEEVVFYCRDCRVTMCGQCYEEDHYDHERSSVEEVAQEFQQRIQQSLDMFAHVRDGRMKNLEALQKRLEHLDQIERVINQKSEELKALVDNDTNKLLASLEEVKKKANDATIPRDLSEVPTQLTEGEDGSRGASSQSEILGAFGGFIPSTLTFTPSDLTLEDVNLIGKLVVVETDTNLSESDSVPVDAVGDTELNSDLEHHNEKTD